MKKYLIIIVSFAFTLLACAQTNPAWQSQDVGIRKKNPRVYFNGNWIGTAGNTGSTLYFNGVAVGGAGVPPTWGTIGGVLATQADLQAALDLKSGYPGAGIPVSTGAAWGASINNNSANWNTAYGWGDHASAGYYTGTSATIRGLFSSSATGLTYTSGTGVFSFTPGYSIPSSGLQNNWNTAYTDRLKWDGGATGLTAATGRTSLGGTTVGQNIFTLTNPGAITFLRMNADNTVTARSAANFKADLSLENVTNESKATMFANSVFTGTHTIPSPFIVGATSVTTTGTQLNYLNAATGTTGTTSANLVFSEAPTINDVTLTGNTQINDSIPFEDALFTELKLYNVLDYDAAGDGVTDDTEEIQAAIDAAIADTPNGTIYLPPNTYIVSDTIVIRGSDGSANNTTLMGAGPGSIIYCNTANKPVLKLQDCSNILVKNLAIKGNESTNDEGILLDYARDCNFDNVYVQNNGQHGIKGINGTWGNKFTNCHIDNNLLDGVNSVTVTSQENTGQNGNAYSFVNCLISANGNDGIEWSANQINITGCHFELNGGSGVQIGSHLTDASCTAANITGNYFEENDSSQIKIYCNATGSIAAININIENNFIYSTQEDGDPALITQETLNGSTSWLFVNSKIGKNYYYETAAAITDYMSIESSRTDFKMDQSTGTGWYTFSASDMADGTRDWGGIAMASPRSVSVAAGTGIATINLQPVLLTSHTSPIDSITTDQIADGFKGQTMRIIGHSDVNYLTLWDGGNLATSNDQRCVLGAGDFIDFTWMSSTSNWHEMSRSESNLVTKTFTIGTPGDTEMYNFVTAANHNEQVLTLTNVLPAKCRVTAVEIVCTETLAGSGTHEIVFQFGTSSSGEELIAATGAGTMDDVNECQGIIDATKPATVQINWASASSLYLTGDPDANWSTLTAGKWTVYVTFMNYGGR